MIRARTAGDGRAGVFCDPDVVRSRPPFRSPSPPTRPVRPEPSAHPVVARPRLPPLGRSTRRTWRPCCPPGPCRTRSTGSPTSASSPSGCTGSAGSASPAVPYLGTFPETNVRLYSVDAHGRRGVVFRSLDASRLIPVLMAPDRVPAAVRVVPDGRPPQGRHRRLHQHPALAGTARRAQPDRRTEGRAHRGAHRAGTLPDRPLGHAQRLLRRDRAILPNAHPRWPLHRAELIECDGEPGGGGRSARAGSGRRSACCTRRASRTFRPPRPPNGIPAPR